MTKPLFDSFDDVSAKEWKQKIQFDLKGADYNEALIHKSYEGIDIKPFYHQEDISNINTTLQTPTHWNNVQTIEVTVAVTGNNAAIQAIEKGAESIHFIITDERIDPTLLLQNIHTDIYIETVFLSEDYMHTLNDIASASNNTISVLLDIIGNLTVTGNWYHSLQTDFAIFDAVIQNNTSLKNIIYVDSSVYQNAGATMVQQLAYGLAHANEYLNHLDHHFSTPPNTSITFKTAIGGNYFFEIAKLKALRILWDSLSSEYEMLKKCYIFTIPSHRNKTILDYNVNILRTTTECMSAILGGADMIKNIRYDDIYHHTNEFGTRIALNQLLILKNESYFDMVSNPASGSYYIESLTHQLSEKALALFKNIEKGGGFLYQLKTGTIQKKIKESADKEQLLFDKEEIVLTGANKYINDDEMTPTIEKALVTEKKVRKTLINPIVKRRLCEKLEKITLI